MRKSAAFLAVLATAGAPLSALAAPLPMCAQLGTDPAYGLAGNPQITALTATFEPASQVCLPSPPFPPGTCTNNAAYCRVDFTFSGQSGAAAGYLPGQSEQIKIRVGLPLSGADGGAGGLKGAWNGKNRDLGGGGYAGAVGGVTSSTNLGYVGTSTDTGHTGGSGSFALNPDKTLNIGLIRDFARDGIRQQHLWGLRLAKTYYGVAPLRKYWMGCSTGGRQGHYQAQNFPDAYDGILAGAPAFNWDRFIPAELWPQIVMNQELGAPISSAKLTAVSNAAIAACDAIDGVTDGVIEDPRRCKYDAKSFICAGGPGDPSSCLTAAEAVIVNKIWDGPVTTPSHHRDSGKAWYGLERGAQLTALAGGSPFPIAVDHYKFWIKQDPAFDWKTVTEPAFFKDFVKSIAEFNKIIGTDDGLEHFRRAGGKMITYHGLFDQLIMPRGTYNYYNNVSGSIEQKQKFYRFFPYPNAGHCGGAGLDAERLFTALVDWVENKVEPNSLVAQVSPTRTRKICQYPDVQVYNGTGSTDDHANFTCQVRHRDDRELLAQDELDVRFKPFTARLQAVMDKLSPLAAK